MPIDLDVLAIIKDVTLRRVSVEDPLIESGLLDSMSMVRVLLAVEEKFHLAIPPHQAAEILATPASLVDYIQQESDAA